MILILEFHFKPFRIFYRLWSNVLFRNLTIRWMISYTEKKFQWQKQGEKIRFIAQPTARLQKQNILEIVQKPRGSSCRKIAVENEFLSSKLFSVLCLWIKTREFQSHQKIPQGSPLKNCRIGASQKIMSSLQLSIRTLPKISL